MRIQRLSGLLAAAFLAPGLALGLQAQAQAPAPATVSTAGQSAVTAPAQKVIGTPSNRKHSSALIVVNARGAKLVGQKLSLEGVAPNAVLFMTRPARGVGHMLTPEMVDIWTTGSFAKDPPNATVSVFQKDGSAVSDIVAVLKSPKLDGDRLTFDVQVLEGSIANADGPASIFIDTVWFGVGGSQGLTYLGQNQTVSESPAIGSRYDTSAYGNGQWSNPAPTGPYYSNQPSGGAGAPPPPELDPRYGKRCGAPPLLPCY